MIDSRSCMVYGVLPLQDRKDRDGQGNICFLPVFPVVRCSRCRCRIRGPNVGHVRHKRVEDADRDVDVRIPRRRSEECQRKGWRRDAERGSKRGPGLFWSPRRPDSETFQSYKTVPETFYPSRGMLRQIISSFFSFAALQPSTLCRSPVLILST